MGNVDVAVVEVAKKVAAVGVEVAITFPVASTARTEFAKFASVSCPRLLKEDVAVPPKYAVPKLEKLVDDAPPEKSCNALQMLADERRDALLVRQVPEMAKQPPERLKPTFEVEVALPEMVRPESVVVPKPVPETERNDD